MSALATRPGVTHPHPLLGRPPTATSPIPSHPRSALLLDPLLLLHLLFLLDLLLFIWILFHLGCTGQGWLACRFGAVG